MSDELIIDANNATLGRLASYVVKQALQGKTVVVLNSEKAIISGRKKAVIQHYSEKKRRGGSSQKGPFFPREPERIVKRTLRGMLPDHRRGRGKEAFKRISCYKGIPEKYKESKMIRAGKEKKTTYIEIEEIAKKI